MSLQNVMEPAELGRPRQIFYFQATIRTQGLLTLLTFIAIIILQKVLISGRWVLFDMS